MSNMDDQTFAKRFGFYPRRLWWIEQYAIQRGHHYRYHIAGTNGMRDDERIYWSIPNLRGAFAFRLELVQ